MWLGRSWTAASDGAWTGTWEFCLCNNRYSVKSPSRRIVPILRRVDSFLQSKGRCELTPPARPLTSASSQVFLFKLSIRVTDCFPNIRMPTCPYMCQPGPAPATESVEAVPGIRKETISSGCSWRSQGQTWLKKDWHLQSHKVRPPRGNKALSLPQSWSSTSNPDHRTKTGILFKEAEDDFDSKQQERLHCFWTWVG